MAPDASQLMTLYELAPGDAQPRTLYQSPYALEGIPLAQRLTGGLHSGLVNLPGWVPLMATDSEYTTGGSSAGANGVPSQVVSLDDGRAITLPGLAPANEIPPSPTPPPTVTPIPTEVAWPLGEIELMTDPAVAPYALEFRYIKDGQLGSPAAAQAVAAGQRTLLNGRPSRVSIRWP